MAIVLVVLGALGPRRAAAQESAARPEPPGTVLRGVASGGGSVATLFGISSTALHLDAGVGFQERHAFILVTANAELGRTPGRLSAGEITVSATVQRVFGRARLGGGIDLGYGWIGRAPTSDGPHIGMYALDAVALVTVDVIDLGEHRALYLGVRPSIGLRWGESFFAWGHETLTWRGAAVTGIRF
jgi:hypothetical protein